MIEVVSYNFLRILDLPQITFLGLQIDSVEIGPFFTGLYSDHRPSLEERRHVL